ncbi:DUF389 domain-containing protein [Lusitaniella coriacea]|uniref:DUF389 domain-containing protein n=1 Tax=Lusitaniella coriacea TaxID=1983105 RepID=UPI003CE783D0
MRQLIPPRFSSLRQVFPVPPSDADSERLDREFDIDGSWNTNYVVLLVSSCAIATFGLISNSTAVIIGAMLVAPLMLPLRALAFAALEGNLRLFRKAAIAIVAGTAISILLSGLIGAIANIPTFGSEITSRTQPNLVDLGIAVAAGGISGFAKIRKGISDALAGTAISVALMPPLCVVGLAFSQKVWSFSQGAFLLYLTNLLGITVACMTVFTWFGYTKANRSFGLALAFTGVLFLPLGANFLQLLQQARLQAAIEKTLRNKTVTISQEGVELVDKRVNWSAKPVPIIYLLIDLDATDSDDAPEITPRQVGLVQELIVQEMGRPLKLIFVIDEVRQISADDETKTQSPQPVPGEPLKLKLDKPPK